MGDGIVCLITGRSLYRRRLGWPLVLLAILAMAGASGCAHTDGQTPPQATVAQVDLERYMGRWYEIASLPNWFQRNCTCTTAEYRWREDYVEVINACRDGSPQGQVRKAEGKATVVEGSSGAKLKVSFFWPFKGDYWIIALDPGYQWTMVGHPHRKYLWILSRTPQLPAKVVDDLLAEAQARGYPVDQIKRTDQACKP